MNKEYLDLHCSYQILFLTVQAGKFFRFLITD